MDRFKAAWGDAERYPSLFHHDARIFTPGIGETVGPRAAPEYIHRMRAVLPDVRLDVKRWSAAEEHVFIEWEISATAQGEHIAWPGVSRFSLRGELASEEVAYFETLPLWARIDPAMQRPGLLSQTTGGVPGVEGA